LSVPVIVTEVVAATPVVATVKVAEEAPAGIVTDGGRAAFELFELKLTVAPPAAATPFKVTAPLDEEPPKTVAGERETVMSEAGMIVNVAGREALP
jgi:hypothetical protein